MGGDAYWRLLNSADCPPKIQYVLYRTLDPFCAMLITSYTPQLTARQCSAKLSGLPPGQLFCFRSAVSD